MVVLFAMIFLNLFFDVFNILSSFIRGSIGLVAYPLCIFFVVIGVLKMMDINIKANKKTILLSILWIIGFISIIQIPTASFNKSFVDFVMTSFKYGYTAGGAIFSIIIYPVELLLGNVGAYVFFAIYLIIMSTLCIDKMHAYFSYSNFMKTSKQVQSNNQFESNEIDEDEEMDEEDDEDIIDEQDFDISDGVEIIDDTDEQDEVIERKSKAIEILNLNNNSSTYENKNKLDKNDIFTSDDSEELVDENEDLDFEEIEPIKKYAPIRTLGEFESRAGRKVVLHDVNDEPIFSPEAIRNQKQNTDYKEALANVQKQKEHYDKKQAALEYLNISKGDFVRKTKPNNAGIDNVSKPRQNNIVNNVKDVEQNHQRLNSYQKSTENDASKYIKDFKQGSRHNQQDNSYDIYDENLTKQKYEQNQNNFTSNLDRVNDAISSLSSKVKENYTFDDNNSRVEAQKVQAGVQITINDLPKRPTIQPKPQPVAIKPYRYTPPPVELLDETVETNSAEEENTKIVAQKIIETYANFQLDTSLVGYSIGPTFTRYELQLNTRGKQISTVSNYAQDLCYELGVETVRMEVPIPGRNAFGVEVPNKNRVKVNLRTLIESPKFKNAKSPLTAAIGQNISGECVTVQINKLIHTLMAGTSGSGKSVCLNVLLTSLLYKASPEDVRLLIIDPKMVEFSMFTNLPHMLVPKTIVSLEKALQALDWVIKEMERRYKKFEENFVKNLEEFNESQKVKSFEEEKMYYIIVIFDEVADYMAQARKEIDDKIKRLAAKARAAGIHLILATQRPTTDVITGTIKANMSSRMALTVKTVIDSRTILDEGGAECLLGYGDMILAPYGGNKVRLQCAYLSNEELKSILDFIRDNNEARFDPSIEEDMFNPDSNSASNFNSSDPNSMEFDSLMKDSLKLFLRINRASASAIQANFNVGFPRASKIVAQMEKAGFVGKDAGNKAILLITQQEFEEKFGEGIND